MADAKTEKQKVQEITVQRSSFNAELLVIQVIYAILRTISERVSSVLSQGNT